MRNAEPSAATKAWFTQRSIYGYDYIPRAEFDEQAKQGGFRDGPCRDSFGDGYGEPYNPNRQAFGILRNGRAVYTALYEVPDA